MLKMIAKMVNVITAGFVIYTVFETVYEAGKNAGKKESSSEASTTTDNDK